MFIEKREYFCAYIAPENNRYPFGSTGVFILPTGRNNLVGIIPGQTFADTYDEFDVDRKVCSRCLEDAGTLACAIVPWSSAALYMSGVLGVSPLQYIPYTLLAFVVPIFSMICAFTGFGMWNSKGEPMWKKKKNA